MCYDWDGSVFKAGLYLSDGSRVVSLHSSIPSLSRGGLVIKCQVINPGPEIKKKFMLNSAEHEILNARKYQNTKKFSISQAQISLGCYFFCS